MSPSNSGRNKSVFSRIAADGRSDENSQNNDMDTLMADSDDILQSQPSSASERKVNLNQSIGSLRDVEMCTEENKHHATNSRGSTPKPSIPASEEDDLYYHPSSSRRTVGSDDYDDEMATSMHQGSRRSRDSFVDEDEENEDEEEEENAGNDEDEEEEEEDDNPFRTAQSLLQHFQDPFGSMAHLITGFANRINPSIEAITQREDPMNVMVGLQEFAEIILLSNEETLIEFLPTQKVLEALTDVMVDPMFEDNVEISLLTTRCLCNLLDAHPSSLDKYSYTRVVQVLCQKLFEIQYIDIAEQALTVGLFYELSFPSNITGT